MAANKSTVSYRLPVISGRLLFVVESRTVRTSCHRVDQLRSRPYACAARQAAECSAGEATAAAECRPNTTEYCSTLKADTAAVEVNTQHELVSVAAGYGVSLGITAKNRVAVWGAIAAGIGGRRESVALATPQLLGGIWRTSARSRRASFCSAPSTPPERFIRGDSITKVRWAGRRRNSTPCPDRSHSLPPASTVALGRGYMLALTRDGQLYAWGSNAAGQLGLGHLRSVATPQPMPLKT